MAIIKFSAWKRAVFRCGKDIKGLRGGVHRYAAQVSLQIDATPTEKSRLRMKTNSVLRLSANHNTDHKKGYPPGVMVAGLRANGDPSTLLVGR